MAPKIADAKDLTLAEVIADMQPRWKREATWTDKQRQARELQRTSVPPPRCARSTKLRSAPPIPILPLRSPFGCGPAVPTVKGTIPTRPSSGKTPAGLPGASYRQPVSFPVAPDHQARRRGARPADGAPGAGSCANGAGTDGDQAQGATYARTGPGTPSGTLAATRPRGCDLDPLFRIPAGEVFGLKVAKVDFVSRGIWLAGEDVKDREDAFLPGAPDAMVFLKGLVAQARERRAAHLITFRQERKKGEPEAWRPLRACARLGHEPWMSLKDRRYRWHDFRAAFITHVAR